MSASASRRRVGSLAAAVLLAVGLSTVDASPASATGVGYVRLAHLSPDTPSVDVYLSSQSGAIPPKVFPGVGYGVVSDYLTVPTGTYAVAMRTAGAAATTPPVLSTQVTVVAGAAYTVAGVGRFADLGLRVIPDDLTLPTDGQAKVRIIQASVRAPVLDVAVAGGATIADGVAFATTTAYREVAPGHWTLTVKPASGGAPSNLDCVLAAGNVYSLLVLDAAGGGLKAELRTDAQREGGMPKGGVETGAGGTSAPRGPEPPPATSVAAPVVSPAAPTRVRIPAIGVNSALQALHLDARGALVPPADYATAGWYADGTAPGDVGPAVIAAHVDSRTGPAVFFRLRDLRPGDLVQVARGGRWLAFRVVATARYPKNRFPAAQVYGPTPDAQLRLITCGGAFDRSRGSYVDNVVVYAVAA